jgi:hypothetical protein
MEQTLRRPINATRLDRPTFCQTNHPGILTYRLDGECERQTLDQKPCKSSTGLAAIPWQRFSDRKSKVRAVIILCVVVTVCFGTRYFVGDLASFQEAISVTEGQAALRSRPLLSDRYRAPLSVHDVVQVTVVPLSQVMQASTQSFKFFGS